MVMSRLKIPNFEELLKKVRQPKAPVVSASVTLDQKQAGEIGHTLAGGWRLQDTGRGISLLSPRGNVFNVNKISPEGRVADFMALRDGKPVKIPPLPPLPPPEPIDEQVRKQLKDFEVKRGNISPVSAPVTPQPPPPQPVPIKAIEGIEPGFEKGFRTTEDIQRQLAIPRTLGVPELAPPAEQKLPEPRQGIGFALDILTGRKTTENPQGLTAVEYAQTIPLAEAAIVGIPTAATLGVVGYQGLKAATDLLLRASIMRNLSLQSAARGVDITREQAEAFANDLTAALSRRFSMGQNWKNIFNFARGKYVPKPEAAQEAENMAKEAVSRFLIPRGTQSGIVFGGKVAPGNGDQIARALGIRFDGIQKGTANIPDKLQFTDPQTGSTTYGNTLEEVKTNIENMRAKFTAAEVLPEKVTPAPEVTVRRFISSEKVTEVTQARTAPWRVSYEYKGKEYAQHFPSREKAVVWAREKLGLELDPKTLQPISAAPAVPVTPEITAFAPEYVRFLESIKGKQLTDLTFREGGISPLGGRLTDAYLGNIRIGSFSNKKEARDSAIKVIGQAETIGEPAIIPQAKPVTPAPLHTALIQEGEQLVAKFESAKTPQNVVGIPKPSKYLSIPEEVKAKLKPTDEISYRWAIEPKRIRVVGERPLTEENIERLIEEPAQVKVRQLLSEGNKPITSNAYGLGKKGILYQDKEGIEQFLPLTRSDYSTEDLKQFLNYKEQVIPGGYDIAITEAIPAQPQPAPLHTALIQEGEQLVAKAEKISPQDANVVRFKAALEAAKSATTPQARTVALKGMEGLEAQVRASSGMAPSTSVQTGLPGIGKEEAQVQMFGEVSGKESRKVPLTQPPAKGTALEGQVRLFEPVAKYDRTPPEQMTVPQITEYLKTKRGMVNGLIKENPDIEFGTKTEVRIYPLSEYHQFLVKAENSEGEARNTAIAGMQFFEPKLKERLKLFNIKIPKSVVQEPVLYPSRVEIPQSREIFEAQETIPPQIKEGEAEAFREAEAETQEIADKAAVEAQAKREMLRADPVAGYRFKMAGRNVGLDSLISIKEQSFPEYLTVKQAQALNPEKSFAKYTVKGTKFYNKVPKDVALDQLTKEFNMTPDEIASRVMAIRAEKRAISEAPPGLPPQPPPPPPTVPERPPAPEPPEDFAGNIRLSKYPEDLRQTLKDWANEHPDEIVKARRGVRSDAQVLEDAQRLVEDVGGDFKRLQAKWKAGDAWNAEEILALRGVLRAKTQAIIDAQKLVQANPEPIENLVKLNDAILDQADIQQIVTGITAEAGRALRQFRQEAFDATGDAAKLEKLLEKIGGRDKVKEISEALGQLDFNDPVAVNNFVRNILKPGLWDYITEIYYNSILSGPKTHIVNSLSNTFNALMSPVERFAAVAVEFPLARIQVRPRARFFNEVTADAFGAMEGVKDGFAAWWKTMRTGISPEQASKYEIPRIRAFKGFLGRVINFPSNNLEAADALMRQVNYRAVFNAVAKRSVDKTGKTGQEAIDALAELKLNPTKELLDEAARVSEYRLFRAPPGKFARNIISMRGALNIGGFKPITFLLPFVRTPANLLKYGLERSPAGWFNPRMWDNIKKARPEAADQIGRALLGTLMAAAIAVYVKEGLITGATPSNAAERDRFYRDGKQPFSVRIGDNWISYQRLEPFNQSFALVAAVMKAMQDKEADISSKIGQIFATISQNMVSQTYLSGLANTINAIRQPERYGEDLLTRLATALAVPASSLTRTIAQILDPTVRQPRTLTEAIKAGIPGLSKQVPAKVTAFGEDVVRKSPAWSPINISPVQQTAVTKELDRLEINTGFISGTIAGVVLTDMERREYQRVAGKLTAERITEMIEHPAYSSLSDENKERAIERTVNEARDQARKLILDSISQEEQEVRKRDGLPSKNAVMGTATASNREAELAIEDWQPDWRLKDENYWNFTNDKKTYERLKKEDKLGWIKDNPAFVADQFLYGDRLDWKASTYDIAIQVALRASRLGVPLSQIPAFSLTDKGKERIPTDKKLWPSYFDYNDLPSGSYLAMTQGQVDAGLLPEKYRQEWETYHKLKTDTAKDVFRKAHKEVAYSNWRDDLRRANPEFNKWLQDNEGLKPLPVKKTVARRGPYISTPVRVAAIRLGGGFGAIPRPRVGRTSLPKFKKPKVARGLSISAPRAPGV